MCQIHCVVVLNQDTELSTGSTQEDPSLFKAAYSGTFIKTDLQNSRTNRWIFIFLAVLQRKKNYVKNPDVRIGYGKMLMSANCNIQWCLSIFVFFRRRDQLINLFPNKMLTWGRQTFAISLVRHTDAEVCEETTMTLLIYRHSLKKSANYTVYLTQSWNKFARKNHSVATVTSLVMTIGKEVLNGENFTASIKYSRPFVCVDAYM